MHPIVISEKEMETSIYYFGLRVSGQGDLVSSSIMTIAGSIMWLVGVIIMLPRFPSPPQVIPSCPRRFASSLIEKLRLGYKVSMPGGFSGRSQEFSRGFERSRPVSVHGDDLPTNKLGQTHIANALQSYVDKDVDAQGW